MMENIIIYFKWKGRIYSLMMNTSEDKITLSMLEGRICTKLGLDESRNNCRYVSNVDVITPSELPEQLSRVELLNKSYVGKKYAKLDSNEDEMRDDAAIVMGECEEQGKELNEAIVEVDDTQDPEIG
ncbi:MULE transposase N-terminal all-beta domain [Arabidopsis suecica]|uniref:MULE transposase N-terminal all-beta domain-containing protein n=2 Tax=Arabidopsis TaxID=3701 RepID=A0A178W0L4_ARATH|nr:MULE transposase N-terminal all-beta domain [Arabidopsis suecica]OAP11055.1 hypothetical protein AXX17_AT2G07710 [Arabidopsis thaliana]